MSFIDGSRFDGLGLPPSAERLEPEHFDALQTLGVIVMNPGIAQSVDRDPMTFAQATKQLKIVKLPFTEGEIEVLEANHAAAGTPDCGMQYTFSAPDNEGTIAYATLGLIDDRIKSILPSMYESGLDAVSMNTAGFFGISHGAQDIGMTIPHMQLAFAPNGQFGYLGSEKAATGTQAANRDIKQAIIEKYGLAFIELEEVMQQGLWVADFGKLITQVSVILEDLV